MSLTKKDEKGYSVIAFLAKTSYKQKKTPETPDVFF